MCKSPHPLPLRAGGFSPPHPLPGGGRAPHRSPASGRGRKVHPVNLKEEGVSHPQVLHFLTLPTGTEVGGYSWVPAALGHEPLHTHAALTHLPLT